MNFKILLILTLNIINIYSNPVENDGKKFQLNERQIEKTSSEDLSINKISSKALPIDTLNNDKYIFNNDLRLNNIAYHEVKLVKKATNSSKNENKTVEESTNNKNITETLNPFNVTVAQAQPDTSEEKVIKSIKILIGVFLLFIILALIHIISNVVILYKLNQSKYKYVNLNDKKNKNNSNINMDEEEADIDIKLINAPKNIYTTSNNTNEINVTVGNNNASMENMNSNINNYPQINKNINNNMNSYPQINENINNNNNNNNPSQFNIADNNNNANINNNNNGVVSSSDDVPREFLENMILSSVRNPLIQDQIMQLLRCPNDDQLYNAEPIYDVDSKGNFDEKK